MQRVLAFELGIDPAPQHERSDVDWAGNWRNSFTVTVPHRELRYAAPAVCSVAPAETFDAQDTLAWEAVRQRLRYEAGAAFEPASQFVFASPYVPPLPALREFALPSFAPGRPLALAAIDLMARIHSGFAYRSAATTIDTPLAEVLARRAGVCQDFAHLMIGALRSLGLAATLHQRLLAHRHARVRCKRRTNAGRRRVACLGRRLVPARRWCACTLARARPDQQPAGVE